MACKKFLTASRVLYKNAIKALQGGSNWKATCRDLYLTKLQT